MHVVHPPARSLRGPFVAADVAEGAAVGTGVGGLVLDEAVGAGIDFIVSSTVPSMVSMALGVGVSR